MRSPVTCHAPSSARCPPPNARYVAPHHARVASHGHDDARCVPWPWDVARARDATQQRYKGSGGTGQSPGALQRRRWARKAAG
eukprot:3879562-Rhodomonas_salina.3